jgi:aminoglycoside phosphotransferase (APT) family kinase protein
LLGIIDDGEWVVLIFEEIEGQPPRLPWSLSDLAATFAALERLSTAATPCPVPGVPTYGERHVEMFGGYRRLAGGDPTVDAIDQWSRTHLGRLAELEAEWEAAAAGDALVHSDLRADNLLVRPDGRVVVVDWPHASVGAPWVDLV